MPTLADEIESLLREGKFTEAIEEVEKIPVDERSWEINFHKIRAYNNIDDFSEKRLEFIKECLEAADKADFVQEIAFITEILTYYYRTSKNFDGLEYVKRGLALVEALNDESENLSEKEIIHIADLMNNVAIIYSNTNQHDLAVEALEKRIVYLEDIGQPDHKAVTYANLGYVYHSMGRIKNSLDVQLKALEIVRETNNKRSIAIYLNNIGGNYATLGDLELAEKSLIESIALSEEINMGHLSCYTHATLSSVYQKRGDFDTALSYLDEAFELQHQFNDIAILLNIAYKKAEVCLEISDVDGAKEMYDLIVETIKSEPPESRFHEYPIVLDALILKQSKLYKNKLKAELILREFLEKEKPLNSRLQLQAFLNLSDLLLEQLAIEDRQEAEFEDQEKEILVELQNILNVINDKAILEESIDLKIQSQILIAYLKLAEVQPEEALEAFEQASFYSKISGIEAIAIQKPNIELNSDETVESNFTSFNPEIVRSLDNIIHSIPRLEIILLLTQHGRLTYTELREYTGLTPGNLGRHCNKLVEVGYIFKDKDVVDDKFLTVYEMTPEGLNSFNRYTQLLSPILKT